MAILGLNNYTQKAASLTGDFLGDILGIGNSDYPMYDRFYNAILADANNALPEASHWVGFFTMPVAENKTEEAPKSLKQRLLAKLSSFNILEVEETAANDWFKDIKTPLGNGLDPHKWTLGDKTNNMANQFTSGIGNSVMFITGVDLPEDGFDVNRPSASYNVGGFTKGIVGSPRKDFANLKITFLENNSSLVDLVIKPWMIHSSYSSLKFAKNATFTLYNLVRSPTGFRIRKRVEFYHVVPVSIDGEAYTYSAATDYTKRQTQFIFSDYVIAEGEGLEDSMLSSVINWAKRLLLRSATALVEGGVDLAIGSGERVLTNVTGALVKHVRDAVVDTQSRIREYVEHAEETLIEAMVPEHGRIDRTAPGMLMGVPNAVGTSPVTIPVDDHIPLDPLPISDITTRNNVEYSILRTDRDDTPDSSALPLSQVQINPNDTSLGIDVNEVRVNADDTPDSSQGVPSVEVQIESDDTPIALAGVSSTPVTIDPNDTPTALTGVSSTHVAIDPDDTPTALTGVSSNPVIIDANDTPIALTGVQSTPVEIDSNDTPVSLAGVSSTPVEIDFNDTPNPLNIKFDEVNIGRNDTPKSSALGVSNIEINADDTVAKKSKINTTIVNISDNDVATASNIKSLELEKSSRNLKYETAKGIKSLQIENPNKDLNDDINAIRSRQVSEIKSLQIENPSDDLDNNLDSIRDQQVSEIKRDLK